MRDGRRRGARSRAAIAVTRERVTAVERRRHLGVRVHVGAREVDQASGGEYYRIVAHLAQQAGLPMPRVFVMDNAQPNAFATGRGPSSAAVCASTGLLEMLSAEEVAGVMAHELAHVRNRDTLTMAVAASIGGAVSMLAQWMQFGALFGGQNRGNGAMGWIGTIAAILIAPFAAMLVQMAISRSREYQADRLGAQICGQPLWLASALTKIDDYAHRIRNEPAEAAPGTAHMFIINPLSGEGMDSLFSTHPNTANRVAELEQMAAEWDRGSRPASAAPPSGSRGPWG